MKFKEKATQFTFCVISVYGPMIEHLSRLPSRPPHYAYLVFIGALGFDGRFNMIRFLESVKVIKATLMIWTPIMTSSELLA